MKTSDLSGIALDYAVAIAEGWEDFEQEDNAFSWHQKNGSAWLTLETFRPSSDWAQSGPIIERAGISVAKVGQTLPDAMAPHAACWCSHIDGMHTYYSETPLVAAMRCFIASRVGLNIEIPSELV